MLHVRAHRDAAQLALACGAKVRHATPQAPQLAELDARLTQALPQTVWPAGHEVQSPLEQTCPAAQVSPQVPQFFGSEVIPISHPLVGSPSQST